MPATCDRSSFRRSVNMSAAQIAAWAKNPISREASFAATRQRLPRLAALKRKVSRGGTLSAGDCAFMKRVISFNARMSGVVRQHGCTRKAVISLRNWGHHPRGCAVPR